ncbi:MAG TPA: YciI family protein [Gammaproteobacteria bacterium]
MKWLIALCALIAGALPVMAAESADTASVRCLVIYRPGPAWPKDTPVSALPLKEHGRYMLGLYAKDVLELAGPLGNDAGGAVLLNVPDRAAAEAIVLADPAVMAGIFNYEIHEWRLVAWEHYLHK